MTMTKPVLFALASLLAGSAASATNCDALRDQIDAKINAAGVLRYSVTVVDAGDGVSGRVVGSCDFGKKKIVYRQETGADPQAPAPAAAAPHAAQGRPARAEPVLTECREGYVAMGGDCRKR
jgi:hypothetical protein